MIDLFFILGFDLILLFTACFIFMAFKRQCQNYKKPKSRIMYPNLGAKIGADKANKNFDSYAPDQNITNYMVAKESSDLDE